jgi:mRNA-degrading endonuclease RelE of RelBE toxin-antitoxin system
MIQFVSITSFRKRLAALLKVKRGVYAGVVSEICQAFKDATIEQIRQNRDMILMNNDAVVIKLRMPDKKQKLSKSDGYRLIYLVMKQIPLVVLLDIYPKRGPSQQLDIEDNEINRLVTEFIAELNAGKLTLHNIANNLKEINTKKNLQED